MNSLLASLGYAVACSAGGAAPSRSLSDASFRHVTATPWTRLWAPTWPTGTASPRPRTCPRPDRGRSSPWTARPSRAQPAWPRRGATCLSAVTHDRVATIAQVEVGAKTNEVRHFEPLLAPLDLADTVVTFDALHSVKANITWLVETKKAHCIAVIKTNQPTATPSSTGPALDLDQGPAHRLRHRPRPPRVPLDQDLRYRRQPRRHRFPPRPPAIWVHRRRKPTGLPKPARTSTRSPASPPIKPAPSTSPPPSAGIGDGNSPSPSEMSRSLRTPRPITPALHPAPWPPSATSPSAP
ncbi:hypothetical protein SGLAM104S_01861 [Streptomyces glaucescens]